MTPGEKPKELEEDSDKGPGQRKRKAAGGARKGWRGPGPAGPVWALPRALLCSSRSGFPSASVSASCCLRRQPSTRCWDRAPAPVQAPPGARPLPVRVPCAFSLYQQTFQRWDSMVERANALDFIFPFVGLVGLFCSVSPSLCPPHSTLTIPFARLLWPRVLLLLRR